MKSFRFTASRSGSDISLVMTDLQTEEITVQTYHDYEMYPLYSDRYYSNESNLFVDVLDLADGYGPHGISVTEDPNALKASHASSITLRTLARRAQRLSSDGSGEIVRYNDARQLWDKMKQHIVTSVVCRDADPIIDVRKSHNWNKNQPYATQLINPQAWYVTQVFNRTNQLKDPLYAYRGITAVFGSFDDAVTLRKNIVNDLSFPSYRQIARLMNDSNMLVFHNDHSFAEWIRAQVKDDKMGVISSGTPIEVHFKTGYGTASLVPGDEIETGYDATRLDLTSGTQVTVTNLANRMCPRHKE